MSVVLRSVGSRKFVKHPTEWTAAENEARKFGGAAEALFYCCQHRISNVEIMGKDFKIPVPKFPASGTDKLAE